ncbi:MAG: DUF481 domain-containing protein [bacterium]
MKLFLTFLLIFSFSQIHSQTKIVSPWSASLTFNGLYQSGNTNKFYINGRADSKYTAGIVETILAGSAGYGESKQTKDDNTYFGSLTTDFFYDKKWSPFFLQTLEYNFSKGITIRSQTGIGLKYVLIQDPEHKTSFSIAGIYDYLNLLKEPLDYEKNEVRISLRFRTRQMLIDKHLNFLLTVLYQPVVNEISKKNLYIESTLEVPLTKVFRLNAIYTYAFDNVVSVGRKRADNKLTFGGGFYF